ncbi:transposable element Tc3 transposase [Trichonephila clavipes]|uniref:Transposable element Tc3 transposase n=1 Tax=Trichonephila clavipes TaxID=2585209 RepID=A0A8X6RK40_TRICX|nr:transposable element Tc3 transposase [Trichonephila clavipes]
MTLHSPTENSLAVLNHKILEAKLQVQNVKLGGHPTRLSINRLWHELCYMLRRLVGTTAPGYHDCSILGNEKVSNHGSIPITIDCNVVAFIVFEEEFHQPIKRTKHDGAHFSLNGYVNKQNCRIWSEANPQVYVETPLHPEKLTVWVALWAGGIIGPYFFKNDEGRNVTFNGAVVPTRWRNMLHSSCHNRFIERMFGDRLISRFGPVNWPPRSCDLTPLDYFLWGYVKSGVYADRPQTLDYLEDNIRRVIADIRPQMLGKVVENWTPKLDYVRASRGSPMPEIIFKM